MQFKSEFPQLPCGTGAGGECGGAGAGGAGAGCGGLGAGGAGAGGEGSEGEGDAAASQHDNIIPSSVGQQLLSWMSPIAKQPGFAEHTVEGCVSEG